MSDKLKKEELIGNIIKRVMFCDQFTNNIDSPTEKREKNIQWAVEQIVALIQKPQVTEEWIEKKAERLSGMIYEHTVEKKPLTYLTLQDFIRSLVEEIRWVSG